MSLLPPAHPSRLPITVNAGGIPLTAVFDGVLKSDYGAYFHVGASELQRALGEAANDEAPYTDSNCFLLETSNGLALIDAGSGDHLDPTAGRLANQLLRAGVKPDDIRFVLMTHLHADHVGGLIDKAGNRIFSRATMMLHKAEAEYWGSAPPGVAGEHHPADLSGMALRAYAEGAVAFGDDDEVLPGIRAVHLPGHTPGHSGFLIGSGPDAVFMWGDVVHLPEVQFARPEITTIYDHDAEQAEASRRRAMNLAADAALSVTGAHLRQPPFCRVERLGSGYVQKSLDSGLLKITKIAG